MMKAEIRPVSGKGRKRMERKKKRGVVRWILLAAAVALALLCVLVYQSGGGLGELPGGFELRVSVLDEGGAVTQYLLKDEAKIQTVQQWLRSQKAERIRAPETAALSAPYLGFSDGTGAARWAVWAGGVWVDAMGRAWSVDFDPAALLALFPEVQPTEGTLRDFPNRFTAASLSGTWDPFLLEPAVPPPDAESFIPRAHDRDDEKLYVTVYNPNETPVTCRPDVFLDVLVGGEWYAVPRADGKDEAAEETVVEPESSALFTANTKEVEARYGKLPAGHYRLVLLSYASEFDA